MSNVYAWPVDGITVPAIVVGYPDSMTFDLTFGRGGDTLVVPLWFVFGQGTTKAVRDALSITIGNAADIKTTLDGNHTWGAVDVTNARIEPVASGAITYIAARFDLDVMTQGAMNLTAIMDGIAALCTAAGL